MVLHQDVGHERGDPRVARRGGEVLQQQAADALSVAAVLDEEGDLGGAGPHRLRGGERRRSGRAAPAPWPACRRAAGGRRTGRRVPAEAEEAQPVALVGDADVQARAARSRRRTPSGRTTARSRRSAARPRVRVCWSRRPISPGRARDRSGRGAFSDGIERRGQAAWLRTARVTGPGANPGAPPGRGAHDQHPRTLGLSRRARRRAAVHGHHLARHVRELARQGANSRTTSSRDLRRLHDRPLPGEHLVVEGRGEEPGPCTRCTAPPSALCLLERGPRHACGS